MSFANISERGERGERDIGKTLREDRGYSCMCVLRAGCEFVGGRQEVSEHRDTCSFNNESQLIAVTMKEVHKNLFLIACMRGMGHGYHSADGLSLYGNVCPH